MNEGWLELESDPGLFTLLVEEFGVQGVQVEEIYDLQKPIEGPVFGFIFLFKWIEERRARRKVQNNGEEVYLTDAQVTKEMFFAHQKVPNSCATHALLSVLLNCDSIELGSTLSDLKEYTKDFSAENKGFAISNVPELSRIHNSHAHPEPRQIPEKQTGISTTRARETFHFVSYVPINNRLIELDGLKPHPIDHGPWGENEDWTEKFRRVIGERLDNEGGSSDIRFNLMAVVGDRCQSYEQKLDTLKNNKQIILDALDQLIRATHPHLFLDGKPNPNSSATASVPKLETLDRQPTACPSPSPDPHGQPSPQGPSASRRSYSRELPDPDWDPSQEQGGGGGGPRKEKKKKKKKKKHKKHKKHSKKLKVQESIQQYRLPPALDNHNYAKSPLMSDEDVSAASSTSSTSESESNYLTDDESDEEMPPSIATQPEVGYRMEGILKKQSSLDDVERGESSSLRVTFRDPRRQMEDNPGRDVCRPLSIQTVFDSKDSPSPASSSGTSTDTASELGSAFNSPVCSVSGSRASSPNTAKVLKFRCWKASTITDAREKLQASIAADQLETKHSTNAVKSPHERMAQTRRSTVKLIEGDGSAASTNSNPLRQGGTFLEPAPAQPSPSSLLSQHGKPPFAQNDLLELLKSVEAEIDVYEQKLLDEKEKRNKYKVDDCRRSHNYDPFIRTFLAMLAEQGKLASLVEKHALIKRRQGVSLGRLNKKTNSRKRDRRRRKSRPGSVPAKKRKIR
ncbi:ubiquitin carboxyl-terminal hydrolase BAP1-like [Acanthaster planci]|uniref:Ubiquitin carboxyl-terminal hydrolase n=1 Tax=Acanthaster planci TaxID=133434 RepID=A0A8B7XLU6_ACAPL|nr:ubiquitin carboxyl-terminal hydrolase BAP1-like [Acanthaster planci]